MARTTGEVTGRTLPDAAAAEMLYTEIDGLIEARAEGVGSNLIGTPPVHP
jgi:hypothetical protein